MTAVSTYTNISTATRFHRPSTSSTYLLLASSEIPVCYTRQMRTGIFSCCFVYCTHKIHQSGCKETLECLSRTELTAPKQWHNYEDKCSVRTATCTSHIHYQHHIRWSTAIPTMLHHKERPLFIEVVSKVKWLQITVHRMKPRLLRYGWPLGWHHCMWKLFSSLPPRNVWAQLQLNTLYVHESHK